MALKGPLGGPDLRETDDRLHRQSSRPARDIDSDRPPAVWADSVEEERGDSN